MHDFDLLDNTKELKLLYKETPIWTASLIGGPFAAAYLVAHNFREEGQPDMVRKTWLVAIAVFALNLLIMFLPVFFGYIMLTTVPIVNIAIANLLVNKFQVDFIEKHQAEKGMFLPASKAVWPCILGFLLYAVPMLIIDGILIYHSF